jgi:hypothetical protein
MELSNVKLVAENMLRFRSQSHDLLSADHVRRRLPRPDHSLIRFVTRVESSIQKPTFITTAPDTTIVPLGVFISEDPLEFASKKVNFYVCASDDPIDFVDLSGLTIGTIGDAASVNQALQYLSRDPAMAAMIQQMEASDDVYTIVTTISMSGDYFNPNQNIISVRHVPDILLIWKGLVVTLRGAGSTVLRAELNLARNAIIFRAIRCPSGPRRATRITDSHEQSGRASWHSSRLLTQ